MAGELVANLTPADFFRETSVGYNPWSFSALVDDVRAMRLNKLDLDGYNCLSHIPGNLTMATGLTFRFALADNGELPSDLGKVVRVGITVKRMITGESGDIDAAAGAEQVVNVTLQATARLWTFATLAIANANLDSAVVGDAILWRIRRVGFNAADTAQSGALLLPVAVTNT